MTNLKNEVTKTMATKIQPFRRWSILLGLVLVATTAGAALAYSSGAKGHTFDSTFTKWVINWPPPADMKGVVGGDVGIGEYTGKVISADTDGNIKAIYHFNGSKHSFTADLDIKQVGTEATITGFVTEGWLKGASVTGEYTVKDPCPIEEALGNAFGNVCFEGTLHVQVPK